MYTHLHSLSFLSMTCKNPDEEHLFAFLIPIFFCFLILLFNMLFNFCQFSVRLQLNILFWYQEFIRKEVCNLLTINFYSFKVLWEAIKQFIVFFFSETLAITPALVELGFVREILKHSLTESIHIYDMRKSICLYSY